jgi:hypothetical protein
MGFSRPETAKQPSGYHGASLILPRASQYQISFYVDLKTWDSYNTASGEGTGFWDSFSVSVTDLPYPEQTWSDPIDAPYAWGGANFLDHDPEQTQGWHTLTVPGNPSGTNYLNFVLDTGTPGEADGNYPSWGTIELASPDLDADSNNDGSITAADDDIEDRMDKPGVIVPLNDDDDDDNGIADWQQEGPISGEDDLVPIYLQAPPEITSGKLRLMIGSGANGVRVWSSPQRDSGGPLLGVGTPSTELVWDVGSQPSTLYLEGAGEAWIAMADVRFVLAFFQTTPSTTTVPTTMDAARATNLGPIIEPAISGVGGVVPSVQGAGHAKHFVTPKAAGQFITLEAQKVAGELEWGPTKDLVWKVNDAVTAGETDAPWKLKLSRNDAAKKKVEIWTVKNPKVVETMMVWVVWADISGGPPARHRFLAQNGPVTADGDLWITAGAAIKQGVHIQFDMKSTVTIKPA